MRAPATTADVVHAATRHYLAGRAIEMSGLAAELGIGRATLYRRVGQHENLMGLVLAGRTQVTFAHAAAVTPGTGVARVRAVVGAFIAEAVSAEPLRALVARDPVLFARVVMAPGHVEDTATALVAELIEAETATGAVMMLVPAQRLARAIVRIGDSFMYAHLLAGGPSQVPEAMAIVELLLDAATGPTCAAAGSAPRSPSDATSRPTGPGRASR